ncbi:MAG: MFS transporter [Silvanigrellaceae bacterium]
MNPTLFPHFLAFLLTGGLLAFPGSCLDLILRDFGWSPATFGLAMMLQGGASFVGSRFASSRCGGEHYRTWTARSLWFLAMGVVLYYFADWTTLPLLRMLGVSEAAHTIVRLVGISCIGFGIGTNGIFNNAAALCSGNPSFGLNLLNMGFTAGAVLLPFSTSQYLKFADVSNPLLWRLPAAVLVLAYGVLSAYVLRSPHLSQPPPVQAAHDDISDKFLPLPVIAASLVLFCYVGSEINLSNSLGMMSESLFGFSNEASRVASSFFWGGLLGARLFFTFRSPRVKSYPRIMSVLSGCCLVLFLAFFLGWFPRNEMALIASRILVLALGLCIGGMYSLALGSLTIFFDSVHRSRHFANLTVLSGVAGAVLLPFTYGQLSNGFGLQKSTWFIVFLLVGMLTGASLLVMASLRHRSLSSPAGSR